LQEIYAVSLINVWGNGYGSRFALAISLDDLKDVDGII